MPVHICVDGCEELREYERAVRCGKNVTSGSGRKVIFRRKRDGGIRAIRQRQQSFRMPLKSCDGEKPVPDALGHAVRGALDDADISAREADALMVGAVNQEAFPIKAGKKGIRFCMGKMKLVTLFIAVCFRLRQMLAEPAPEKKIDELHPLADAKDRTAQRRKLFQQGKLPPVQIRIDVAAGRMFFL